jgi:hypothetical protein
VRGSGVLSGLGRERSIGGKKKDYGLRYEEKGERRVLEV